MLEVGKIYEYEYIAQFRDRPRDTVRFKVIDDELGFVTILFDGVSTSSTIASNSPIALMAEEVEHVN